MGTKNNSSDKVYITDKKTLKEFLEYERQKYGRKNARMPLICIGERSYLWKYKLV